MTTPTERRLAITNGTWLSSTTGVHSIGPVDDGGDIVCDAPEYAEDSMKRWKDNSALIADAGTTYNACGLTLSELLAKVREGDAENVRLEGEVQELRKALELIASAKDRGFGIDYARGLAESLVAKHKPE